MQKAALFAASAALRLQEMFTHRKAGGLEDIDDPETFDNDARVRR